jgi:hypothetical protein
LFLDKRTFKPTLDEQINPANELQAPTKHEDPSKMRCSICKQSGHNKRTCKKMTAPVSAAKIEEETDVKEVPHVKVEPEMSSETAHNMLISIIQQQKEKEEKQDIWGNSPYKDLVDLQSNNVGNVGEQLINNICKSSGIDADCDGTKTKKIGGGEGDGKIMGIPIEIKTAHQGSSSPSFQHELGEVPWSCGKYMIFVDIAPECIYITIFKNFNEVIYKGNEKLPCFPTKTVTWRKKKGAFKLDTSVKINELSVKNGHSIKITQTTSNDIIASFIKRIIV